ncbi:MAG TPA: glycosyltransferase family 87 protein [Actinoplanes sp.]|nr:glycosyltransferase family 87 protein [Actinoplanes sp.]
MNNSTGTAVAALSGKAPWVIRLAAFGLYAMGLVRIASDPESNLDNLVVVRAVRHLSDGISPYLGERFLYPPSSVPFALIMAPLPDAALRLAGPFLAGALLLAGWWAALRLFDLRLGSWAGVLPVAAAAFFVPATSTATLGSWSAPAAAALPVALVLAKRNSWVAAGAVIGLSIAVKPMLVPIGLVFLLARKWRGLALAAGLPVVVCACVMLLIPDPLLFFGKTVPFLVHGQDAYTAKYDSSLPLILPRLGIPELAVTVVRLGTAVATVGFAVRRWFQGGHEGLRLAEVSSLLLVGTFLGSTPAFPHYAMLVVPLLVASAVVPGAAARSPWFWLSLVPLTDFVQLPFIDFAQPGENRDAFKPFIWLVTLFGLLTLASARRVRDKAQRPVVVVREPV